MIVGENAARWSGSICVYVASEIITYSVPKSIALANVTR